MDIYCDYIYFHYFYENFGFYLLYMRIDIFYKYIYLISFKDKTKCKNKIHYLYLPNLVKTNN